MIRFEERLATLDTSLFAAIPCQLYEDDRRSLLAIQYALRDRTPRYRYLEIGSYLGGSLQPHLMDPRCDRIYSIDKRPPRPPDDRGMRVEYPENTTDAMLANLARIDAGARAKVVTFETEAARVERTAIDPRPGLCFIDGEHTEAAVLADFAFCRAVASPEAVICFHDCNIIFSALVKILDQLTADGTGFEAYALPSYVFVIELGGVALHKHPALARLLVENWKTVLPSLSSMEHYREVYNTVPVRVLRAVSRRLKRLRRGGS